MCSLAVDRNTFRSRETRSCRKLLVSRLLLQQDTAKEKALVIFLAAVQFASQVWRRGGEEG